jgi:preprotein translocase subunit SecA
MSRFVGPRVKTILERFGMDGEEPLEHKLVSRTIEQAQTKVEGMNFDYRKHLVEYDDVLARQRAIVYEDRNKILRGEDVRDIVMGQIEEEIADLVDQFCSDPHQDEWDTTSLYNQVSSIFRLPRDVTPDTMLNYSQDELTDALVDAANEAYEEREAALGEDVVRAWERRILLVTMSGLWIHHVDAMDELREGALLQAFGQQDPLVVYKRQAHEMFEQFRVIFRKNVVYQIYHVLFQPTAALILQETRIAGDESSADGAAAAPTPVGESDRKAVADTAREAATHSKRARNRPSAAPAGKIGRNDPCYCGSGKKYKHCHGRPAGMTA